MGVQARGDGYARPGMASDPPSSDPFRVRLNWPEHDLVPAARRDQQDDEAPRSEPASGGASDIRDEPTLAYEPEELPDTGGSVMFTVASRLEGLRAALGNIAVRLDSLIRREEQFREFTSTRLAENAEQVALAVSSTKSAIDEQAREQQHVVEALTGLRERLEEESSTQRGQAEHDSRSLSERVEHLSGRLEQDATALREQIEGDSRRNRELLESVASTVSDETRQLAEDVEVVRAELVASAARAEARDEELTAEMGHLAEELRVLRRRMTVRAKPVTTEAEDEPVDQDSDFTPPSPTRGRIRRQRA